MFSKSPVYAQLPVIMLLLSHNLIFAAQVKDPTCNCNYTTMWNDIIYIFDSSAATTKNGLLELLGRVQTDLQWLTVRNLSDPQIDNYYSRVGMIAYSKDAHLVYPLGSINNDYINNISELPFYGDTGTNLEAAINLAMEQFNNETQHRKNVREIIIVLATTYRAGDYQDPTQITESFKENGGILIVYDYVEAHGGVAPELDKIASPGYFCLNLDDTDGYCMLNGLCNANCFCPTNYAPYGENETNGVPLAGCYYNIDTSSAFLIAENRCKGSYSGYLTVVQDAEKQKFLNNLLPSRSYWIGLKYDGKSWYWSDPANTPLDNTYALWAAGQPNMSNTNNYCVNVLVGSDKWSTNDCRTGLFYICETPPCDSEHYCDGNT